MASGFETGSVSNGKDMVAKIRAILEANGVTILQDWAYATTGREITFQLENNGVYFSVGTIGKYHYPIDRPDQSADDPALEAEFIRYAPSALHSRSTEYYTWRNGPNYDDFRPGGSTWHPGELTETVYVYQHKQFTAGQPFYKQAGGMKETHTSANPPDSRPRFDLFRVGQNSPFFALFYDKAAKQLHAVCEYNVGKFSHLGLGIANKTHNFRGGSYTYGSMSYKDYDGSSGYDRFIGYRQYMSPTSSSRRDMMNYADEDVRWSYLIEGNGEDFFTKANEGFGRMTYFMPLFRGTTSSYTPSWGITEALGIPNYYWRTDDLADGRDRGNELVAYDRNSNNVVLYPEYQFCRAERGGYHMLSSIDIFRRVTGKPFQPKEIITIGGQEYMILPQSYKVSPWENNLRETPWITTTTQEGYDPRVGCNLGMDLAIKIIRSQ